jgi:VanZ family protein
MRIVFGFSSDNAETSSSLSKKIAMIFSKKEEVVLFLEPIIRKLAHLSEYALGGFLIYGLFLTYNISSKKQVVYSALIGIFYAMTDEFHQLFIEGRSAQIKDVGIDSLGVILGICFLLLIVKIVKKINIK